MSRPRDEEAGEESQQGRRERREVSEGQDLAGDDEDPGAEHQVHPHEFRYRPGRLEDARPLPRSRHVVAPARGRIPDPVTLTTGSCSVIILML